MSTDELRERLAAIEHERWASWQRWMHAQCERYGDGALLIPADLAARWERQIATPYADLSESEQRSDREQVDRYWPLIEEMARKAAAWDDRARWFALAVERFREAYIGQGETSDRAREIAVEDALLLSEEADHA